MLVKIKLLHTAIWGVLAAMILYLPYAAWSGNLRVAVVFTLIVLVECGVLAANRWQCPLTNLAGRYTLDRADNFDIFLPAWLARYNKSIFGALFAAGELILVWRWLKR